MIFVSVLSNKCIVFIQVRSNPSIKGFGISNIQIKLTAYVDDTTFSVLELKLKELEGLISTDSEDSFL